MQAPAAAAAAAPALQLTLALAVEVVVVCQVTLGLDPLPVWVLAQLRLARLAAFIATQARCCRRRRGCEGEEGRTGSVRVRACKE